MTTSMTKKEMFAHIMTLTEEKEVIEFCEHEIELLNKKSSSPTKPTKTQLENEKIKQEILTALAEVDTPVTITEFTERFPNFSIYSNQKITSIMTQLKKSGLVSNTKSGKNSYYSLSEEEETVQALPHELEV